MCDQPIPHGGLPVLVGAPLATCPTAGALADPEVLRLAQLVPSRDGPGALAGIPPVSLPPRYRHAVQVAHAWLAAARNAEGDA